MTILAFQDDALLSPIAGLRDFSVDPNRYFRGLAASDDEILSVGGILALFERDAVQHWDVPQLLKLCRHGAVRRRAFNYFSWVGDHARAAEVAMAGPSTIEDLDKAGLEARSRNDNGKQRDIEIAKYLSLGELIRLHKAATSAELVEGWRGAVPILTRAVAVKPDEPAAFSALARMLAHAGRYDLLEYTLSQVTGIEMLEPQAKVFSADARLADGDAEGCLARLSELEDRGRTAAKQYAVGAAGEQLRAKAYSRLGRFNEAFRSYATMNSIDATSFKPTSYIADCLARNAQVIPDLPPLDRPNYVMMVGFPRSGTTMLENALAAHPRVETFEEVPCMLAVTTCIDRGNKGQMEYEAGSAALFVEARERYFSSLDRLVQNHDAEVYIDKLPIRSLIAPFIKHLLPNQRFIFSIRHPYDVALSCFQQRFGVNSAMANFPNLVDTIRLYDIAMTEWFKVHSLSDPSVHYVRYDSLVTDFEATAREALEFLALDWDPAVLEFAERAGERAGKTPSYQKVRQGLSLGIQTYWRDYDFLFRQAEAAPLTKWAKFFGYETF
ncbi:MAG TPA: sulfotransferase [Devosia sp.]|jgi:tetratricopeptide (TPR) repeat protein|uniref:tetratricopeptide repeat-containing sulfotransferase family protein n=1 Tax=Devosia sp. TaxID=1871048 RepID=UPI002DDD4B7E|nr:sulfotransferase [Devosia sp.]HEV2518744.1 sulfotransferase [Devosia sp.]